MNNPFYTVCGIVNINEKILLVRHTYGPAQNRILLPGGFVKEHELPTSAVEREIFEETGIKTKANKLIAMQFKPDQWCAVFITDYISGTPRSDNYENSEVLLLTAEQAVSRNDITNTSREILNAYINNKSGSFMKSDFVPQNTTADKYGLFEV